MIARSDTESGNNDALSFFRKPRWNEALRKRLTFTSEDPYRTAKKVIKSLDKSSK